MQLTINQALKKGIAAYKEGKLQEAERVYRTILGARPKHPEANHSLGMVMASTNKFGEALPFFKTAVDASPKTEQFWVSYIVTLIQAEQLEDANEVRKRAKEAGVSQKALDATGLSATGNLKTFQEIILEHYQNNRLQEAEELSISFTEKFPSHSFGWKVLGGIYQQTGRATDALTVCKKVIEIDSKDAGAHNNYGTTLQELQRLEEAEASYRKAIKLKPDFAEAYSNLGNTLQELVRYEESEESYTQAIKLQPGIAEVHNNLGNTLKELCRVEEAEASYRKAIELKPDYAEALSNLGMALEEAALTNKAAASYGQMLSINSCNVVP